MKIRYSLILASLIVVVPTLACAEIIVAAGAKSPIDGLSRDQVAQVFLGKTKALNGNSVKPLDYAGAPKEQFWDAWLGKSGDQLKALYAKLQFTGMGGAPKEVGSLAEAKKEAVADPAVIIYLERNQLDASLKIVSP